MYRRTPPACLIVRLVPLALLLVSADCSPAGQSATSASALPVASCRSWQDMPSSAAASAPGASLAGIAVLSRTDAWAVGAGATNGMPADTVLIEHWNGASWRIVPAPSVPPDASSELNAIATGALPDTLVAAGFAGDSGNNPQALAESWDGVSWKVLDLPLSSSSWSSAFAAVSSDHAGDVIVVGSTRSTKGSSGRILIDAYVPAHC